MKKTKTKRAWLEDQHWPVVNVPRANLYGLHSNLDFGNQTHFNEMKDWCYNTCPRNEWFAIMHSNSQHTQPGHKLFYFKDHKYATMFKLRWL